MIFFIKLTHTIAKDLNQFVVSLTLSRNAKISTMKMNKSQ